MSALAGSDTTFLHAAGKPLTDHPNVAGLEVALVALIQVPTFLSSQGKLCSMPISLSWCCT